jgi:hypothetical protein
VLPFASPRGIRTCPRTQDLEAWYSRAFPGRTCAEQATTVQRWHDAAQRDPETLRAVAFGVWSPSAVERAVGAPTTGANWDQRLADALTDFPDSRRALEQLRAVPRGASSKRRHARQHGRRQAPTPTPTPTGTTG